MSQFLERSPNKEYTSKIFILGYPAGFGAQIKNTLIGFLYAEILNLQPIVVWRDWCLYYESCAHSERDGRSVSAFLDFFQPYPGFEQLSVENLKDIRIFPNKWTIGKILSQKNLPFHDADRFNPDVSIPENFDFRFPEDASIVFSHYKELTDLIPTIPPHHQLHGLSYDEVTFKLYQKYFKLKPEIFQAIDNFWRDHENGKPVLGVHYRGTDKGIEAPVISVGKYVKLISDWQKYNPGGRIFLATDCGRALGKFKSKFKSDLFYWDYPRSHDGKPLHYEADCPSERGREIIRDGYCLSRCDTKIFNMRSNVAHWVTQCLIPPDNIESCMSVTPSIPAVFAFKIRQIRNQIKNWIRKFVKAPFYKNKKQI
jgi:hypothetical protein